MTGRHAGENTSRPGYGYNGRHEAPPAENCPAFAEVHSMDGETGGTLVCSWDKHAGPDHWDESEAIYWREAPRPSREIPRPQPAGAVA